MRYEGGGPGLSGAFYVANMTSQRGMGEVWGLSNIILTYPMIQESCELHKKSNKKQKLITQLASST